MDNAEVYTFGMRGFGPLGVSVLSGEPIYIPQGVDIDNVVKVIAENPTILIQLP